MSGGFAAAGVDGQRFASGQTDLSRSNQDEEFVVGEIVIPLAEEVAGTGEFCDTGNTGNGFSQLVIDEARDDRGFAFFEADGLRHGLVGNDGDAVGVGAAKRAQFIFQLQSDFIVGMNVGSSLDLQPDVFILRAGVRRFGDRGLRNGTGRANEKSDHAIGAGDVVRDRDIRERAAGEIICEDEAWIGARSRFQGLGEQAAP